MRPTTILFWISLVLCTLECRAQYADIASFKWMLRDSLSAIAVTQAGDMIAIADRDSVIRLHSITTGNVVKKLSVVADTVRSVGFSPDGNLLMVRAAIRKNSWWNEVLSMYRTDSGRLLWTGYVSESAFTADSRFLVHETKDPIGGMVRLQFYDAFTGAVKQAVYLQEVQYTASVVISPDGRYTVHNTGREALAIDLHTGEIIQRQYCPEGYFSRMAIAPDSRTVALCGDNNNILFWDVEQGGVTWDFYAGVDTVAAMAFSPDGTTLLLAGSNGPVEVWNAVQQSKTGEFATQEAQLRFVGFNADGSKVVTGAAHAVRTWDPVAMVLAADVAVVHGAIAALHFSPLHKVLATTHNNGSIRLWRYPELIVENTYRIQSECGGALAFLPSGAALAVADGTDILFIDIAGGSTDRRSFGHSHCITSIAFSPDGTLAATGDADGNVLVRNLQTNGIVYTASRVGNAVAALAFSPDARYIAAAWENYGSRITEMAVSNNTWYFNSHFDIVSLRWSPDGTVLAAGEGDGQVQLYDMWGSIRRTDHKGMTSIARLEGCTHLWGTRLGVTSAFTRKSDFAVVGSCRGQVGICVASTGEVRYTYYEHNYPLPYVDVAPDDSFIAAASDHVVMLLKPRRMQAR